MLQSTVMTEKTALVMDRVTTHFIPIHSWNWTILHLCIEMRDRCALKRAEALATLTAKT